MCNSFIWHAVDENIPRKYPISSQRALFVDDSIHPSEMLPRNEDGVGNEQTASNK